MSRAPIGQGLTTHGPHPTTQKPEAPTAPPTFHMLLSHVGTYTPPTYQVLALSGKRYANQGALAYGDPAVPATLQVQVLVLITAQEDKPTTHLTMLDHKDGLNFSGSAL